MKEIKIGEYIRTTDGYIRKVTEVEAEDTIPIVVDEPILDDDTKWRNCYQVMECIDKERITKHSPNIIDLIEVGDVIKYKELFDNEMFGTKANETYILNLKNKKEVDKFKKCVEDKEIEFISIVTHEQFAEMEYKV